VSKQIHIAPGVPPALAKANASNGSVVIGNAPGPQFVAVVLRVDIAPFTDARVVQALKLLTNRPQIVKDAYDGYATIGNDAMGATYQYWASDIKPVYDPERAKSLLKAAGQENLSGEIASSPAVPGMLETATLWSAQAGAVGLKIPVKEYSPAVFYTTAAGNLTNRRPIGTTTWNAIPFGLSALYLATVATDAQYPETGWGLLPGQETLINAALAADPATAGSAWHAAQEQQVKEGGYIIPANPNYLDVYAPNVRGVKTTAAGLCSNFAFSKGWLVS
jgi:peptide/nickel transport system substrate-binding protein